MSNTPIQLDQDTAGAPVLTGEEGALRLVLNWALVQLGWTIAFQDAGNQRVAYRNDTVSGSGSYLKLWDQASDHPGDARRSRFNAYSSMSDIDTGLDETGGSGCLVPKSFTADATVRDYLIVGNKEAFWFGVKSDSNTNPYNMFYFGDMATLKAADAGRFMVSGSTNTANSTNTTVMPWNNFPVSDTNGIMNTVTNVDGSIVDQKIIGSGSYSPSGTLNIMSTLGAFGTYPDPASGGISTYDPLLKEFSSNINRGFFKGMVGSLNNIYSNLTNGQIISGQQTPRGARDCRVVLAYSRFSSASFAMAFLIDIESDWTAW